MYTLEDLKKKSLAELKEIGWELNVLPEGDRRKRQNWIDAIAGVNPPLLQLLEASPAVEVDRVCEASVPLAENSPGVEVDQLQERIEEMFHLSELQKLDEPHCPACGGIYSLDANWSKEYAFGFWIISCGKCDASCSCSIEELPGCFRDDDYDDTEDDDNADPENTPGVEVSVRKRYWADRGFFLIPEAPAVLEENSAVEFDGCIYCTSPEYEWRNETYRCYRCKPEPDQNPILTGIPLSDRFLAHYSPPQVQIIHFQSDADGQLSLLDFEGESVEEPPDPDDFQSLDAFREAIQLWDAKNPEPFAVSLDSMCEWAPCPEEWYEPEQSEVLELLPADESSITSANFTIPTFDAWCDRANRQTDEPPDTGIFARLPGPKPPKFPPRAIGYTQPNRSLNAASRNYPETIPKLFHCSTAGSSTQPARSPPGGDA